MSNENGCSGKELVYLKFNSVVTFFQPDLQRDQRSTTIPNQHHGSPQHVKVPTLT